MPFAPHEVYSRCLLPQAPGYPLWTPQLKTQLCESYQLEGLKIGDVGIVSSNDGSFDVLFNITLERSEQPYPELVRENFTPVPLDRKRDLSTQVDAVAAHGVISSASVELVSREVHSCAQKPPRADYKFSLSVEDGAVLILPEGAESSDLENEKKFLGEAIRHGIEWYECATEEAGRFINNDSLYLITGFHKARSWSLGAAGWTRSNSSPQKQRCVEFRVGQIHQDSVTAGAYLWATTHGFTERVGPTYPYEIPDYIRDDRLRRRVNQTVFIRGFRITVNKILFLKTVSVKTRQGTFFGFGNFVDNFLWGRPTPSSSNEGVTDNTVDQDCSMDHGRLYMDTRMMIDRMPDIAQTFHPGDSINQYMLKKEPRAMIALTHDSLWIEMLQMGFLDITDFSREQRLGEVLSNKYRMLVEDGAVYLQRGSPVQNFDLTSLSSALTVQMKEETIAPGDQPQPQPSSSSSAVLTGENEETIITSIRATNVALGLRRVPAGFYTIVRHSGLEWKTEIKLSFVNDDVVEWNGPIPIPSDPSATVCLEVYASFELQPMLGAGEQLRKLIITVKQLLDRSEKHVPLFFSPKDGNIVSPCSSIGVAVERRNDESRDSLASRVLGPLCSTTNSPNALEDATNHGHSALSRYRKYGEIRYLERSIAEFERALDACLPNQPCRAAAQSNLATAKFVLCLADDTNASFEIPLGLYRNALAARPVGHIDRPSTLIQLAAVHLARSEKGRDGVESAFVEALLHEATELSLAESHENRAANFILQLHAGRKADPVQAGKSSLEQGSASHFTQEPWTLSSQLLERFKQLNDVADLQRAITLLWELVMSIPEWDDRYCEALRRLGMALRSRFDNFGELRDLEEAISSYKEANYLTPQGHPDQPAGLNGLGITFVARFERLGELRDLEDAISMLSDAVDLTPDGHPDRPVHLKNLGNCFLTRFQRLGELSDLENSISTLRDVVDATPYGHPNKPAHLNDLGNSFITRFEHLGELSDLEDAISTLKAAIDLTPQGHPNMPGRLNNLSNSFFTRFHCLGELSDLEKVISTLKDAIDLTPHGHPDKLGLLNSLGSSLFTRFQRLGELSDLENAILMLRDAADLTPHGHPGKPACLNNLSTSFVARFQRLGELSNLENAISTLKDAIDLTPQGHPDKPNRLNNLGISLSTRFERFGELSDLEGAISVLRDAVDLTPHGHPDHPARLKNLGNSFLTRFRRLGELTDLDDAILMLKDAVVLTPHGHPDKPPHLSHLGNAFLARFERLGELSDLEHAISTLRDAVALTPHGHPDKPRLLNHLGNALLARFERLGGLPDLEHAISTLREAIDLTPHDHPDKPGRLHNLGRVFFTRFERLGEPSDLEDAISTLRDAVQLTPSGHPDHPTRLKNLGSSFLTRFRRLGELTDLDDSILMLKDAVDLTPDGHPDKPAHLNDLGNSFVARFERLGELSNLEDATSILNDAVRLTPCGHPYKPARLNNLGNSFFARFERLGELSDLEHAISTLREAIDLTPHGHPDKPRPLSNLGNAFLARFGRLGELSDLEHAISTLRDAVDFTPHGHPHKPDLLTHLGSSLLVRFKHLGELSDLEDAISTLKHAIDLTPHNHPDKPARLNRLGDSFVTRFEHLGEQSDLQAAISLYSYAASSPIGPVSLRFHISQSWISCALRMHHPSLLHAYSIATSLFPQLAWAAVSPTRRQYELTQCADLMREAAAAALDLGFPETAVEWLEQGRSIAYGELAQLRSSLEELSSAYPDHAHRLWKLSVALMLTNATHEEQRRDAASHATKSLQETLDRHLTLALEREKLIHEIRHLPGFRRFLHVQAFSQLHASARSGPVVILNAAESRCDALVVLADVDHVIHVPLPNFTFKQSIHLLNLMKSLLRHGRTLPLDETNGKGTASDGVNWVFILAHLWIRVVKPILDALAFSTGELSRIFWCPTGPFASLPIHAAGLYDTQYSQPGHKVFDFVVSSYVPTLTTLALSHNFSMASNGDLRLLAVHQPPSDGLPRLLGVDTELRCIEEVVRNSSSARTTFLESSFGTVEEVLSLMKEADWVHFACHGIQDTASPTKGGFCLANGRRLKVSDIVALSRPHGGLAFLSACQTAIGDEGLSETVIHLEAGMLFAGYGGVISSMWSLSDRLTPDVVRDVYEQLLRSGTRPDYREAARALYDAVGRLRDSGEASFHEWIPFIHVGL